MAIIVGILVIIINVFAIKTAWNPSIKWIKSNLILEINTSQKHIKRRKKIILYKG